MPLAAQYFKTTGVWLLLTGVLYAVFYYVAHFTAIQSAVLAIIGILAIDGNRMAYKVATKQEPKFEPFWVSVEPNWKSICHDFGLANDEKWAEVQELHKTPQEDYSIIRSGLNFTAISPTLFYSNDHRTFFSELDFNLSLWELRPEPGGFLSFAPQFYVKRTVAGEKENRVLVIEFGLITQESLKKSHHHRDDEAKIPIARLPEIIFSRFSNPDAYWDEMNELNSKAKALLTELGWTEKERDAEDAGINGPSEINHKYLQVMYRGV